MVLAGSLAIPIQSLPLAVVIFTDGLIAYCHLHCNGHAHRWYWSLVARSSHWCLSLFSVGLPDDALKHSWSTSITSRTRGREGIPMWRWSGWWRGQSMHLSIGEMSKLEVEDAQQLAENALWDAEMQTAAFEVLQETMPWKSDLLPMFSHFPTRRSSCQRRWP